MAHHTCQDRCSQYKIPRSSVKKLGDNVGICSDCDIKMAWKKPDCPCCGQKLRRNPRNIKMREREVFRY